MWRYLGMFVLACTGIGAIYMLARTTFIKPGYVGVVTNYSSGENEELQPGLNCILSPLRSFVAEVPGKNRQILAAEHITLHTADAIEAKAKIDVTYTITDAVQAATAVEGTYQDALLKATETALAGIITEHNYTFQNLSSARTLQINNASKNLSSSSGAVDESKDAFQGNILGTLASLLLTKVNEICSSWGIKLSRIQIVNMKAVDPKIEQQIESSSKVQFDAMNKRRSVQADQETRTISAETDAIVMQRAAEARAHAAVIEAKGQAQALQIQTEALSTQAGHLKIEPGNILQLNMQVKTAEALSKTPGTLLFGSGLSLFAANANRGADNLHVVTTSSASGLSASNSSG